MKPSSSSLVGELLSLAEDFRDFGALLLDAYTDDGTEDHLTLSDGTVLTGEVAEAMHLVFRTAIGLGEHARAAILKAQGHPTPEAGGDQ